MNTMIGRDFLDTLIDGLTALFSSVLKALFGQGLERPAIGAITWTDLGVTLCLILLVLLAHALTAAYLRTLIKSTAKTDTKGLLRRAYGALGKVLYLLIWIYGVYIAITPLLIKLPKDGALLAFRNFFDKLFDMGVFASLFWLSYRLTHLLEARLEDWVGKTGSKLDKLFIPLLGNSVRIIVLVVGIIFALPILNLSPEYASVFSKGGSILLILAVALISFQFVNIGEKAVLARYDITVSDNLQARKVYTQVHILGKAIYVIICLFTVASILMLFEEVRRFGTSILASAGVVGIIIGFAAQKTISNLFAGFQLAMTQPIRMDDVVIVEGEWGRVEEFTLTYVVIRLWDERRLVVPLAYFIEKPFQNWTRVAADLLGTVFVWVDYSLPLDETRTELKAIIETHPLWDRRFWNLQVTDSNERAMQIRVLATAADSAKSFDLRCDIREKLIAYIQKKHPQSLPRMRGGFDGLGTGSPA